MALSPQEVEQLAFQLTREGPGTQAAFVDFGNEVVFARHDHPTAAPESALVKLVQGIYETRPEQALSILRRRIFLTHEPTPMCRGMLKVAARRLTAPVTPRDHGLTISATLAEVRGVAELPPIPPLPFSPTSDDRGYMQLALALAAAVPRTQARRFDRDRAIAAVLVSREGEPLAWASNAITRNRTFHAEVVAVQSWWRRTGTPLPAGTRLYTTLKPCRMCAGMVWQASADPKGLRVFYNEDDPGPNARDTVFDQFARAERPLSLLFRIP